MSVRPDHPTPTIRDADEHDLPRIVAILNAAIADTTAIWKDEPTTLAARAGWLAERRAARMPVLVAVDGAAVLGFGSYGAFRPYDGFRHTVEHSLYVDAAARGRGAGTALLAALTAHAGDAGRHVMVGTIEAGNAASLVLHRRAGFVETGRMPQVGRKFGRWLDLVLVQKILGSA